MRLRRAVPDLRRKRIQIQKHLPTHAENLVSQRPRTNGFQETGDVPFGGRAAGSVVGTISRAGGLLLHDLAGRVSERVYFQAAQPRQTDGLLQLGSADFLERRF